MIKRRYLGQHFLKSQSIAKSMVSEAGITSNDTVYEIGTGFGIITRLLCGRAKKVVSVEVDKLVCEQAKARLSDMKNLTLEAGDGFKGYRDFSVFVSCLPYSKSRHAIEWLAQNPFSHGVIMVQDEFAQKLLTRTASQRRAVNIVANHTLEMTHVANVNRKNFDPIPRVNSVILRIRKKRTIDKKMIDAINLIFAYRRKTIRNIFRQLGRDTEWDGRLDDLSYKEIINLAKEII